VAEEDIAFVAEWIDDGCRADEAGQTPLDFTVREVVRGKVTELEFPVANRDARRYAYREGEPRQRANLDCLPDCFIPTSLGGGSTALPSIRC